MSYQMALFRPGVEPVDSRWWSHWQLCLPIQSALTLVHVCGRQCFSSGFSFSRVPNQWLFLRVVQQVSHWHQSRSSSVLHQGHRASIASASFTVAKVEGGSHTLVPCWVQVGMVYSSCCSGPCHWPWLYGCRQGPGFCFYFCFCRYSRWMPQLQELRLLLLLMLQCCCSATGLPNTATAAAAAAGCSCYISCSCRCCYRYSEHLLWLHPSLSSSITWSYLHLAGAHGKISFLPQ